MPRERQIAIHRPGLKACQKGDALVSGDSLRLRLGDLVSSRARAPARWGACSPLSCGGGAGEVRVHCVTGSWIKLLQKVLAWRG